MQAVSVHSESRKALVTGIRGQDGWYLAERLLKCGYEVVGTTHQHEAAVELHVGDGTVPVHQLDLQDAMLVDEMIRTVRPQCVFNLAARASSSQLFDDPVATSEVNGVAVVRLLEAIQKFDPTIRLCQASSCEVFAGTDCCPQDELTAKRPLNAYGAAKAFADHMIAAYRATKGTFACSAILYPHESIRRSPHFLLRKVTQAAARIRLGLQSSVSLGDIAAVRDWGYAPDYMDAMRRMLEQPAPQDFVIATGVGHTVQEVCETAFGFVGLDWHRHVLVAGALCRNAEAVPRIGNPSKARTLLNWTPTVSFAQLVEDLVAAECREIEGGRPGLEYGKYQ